jgi:hypothetical protein
MILEPSLSSFFAGLAEEDAELARPPPPDRPRHCVVLPRREDASDVLASSVRRLSLESRQAWTLLDVEEFSSEGEGDVALSLRALSKAAHAAARATRTAPPLEKQVAVVASALARLSVAAPTGGGHSCPGCGCVFALRKTLALHSKSCGCRSSASK